MVRRRMIAHLCLFISVILALLIIIRNDGIATEKIETGISQKFPSSRKGHRIKQKSNRIKGFVRATSKVHSKDDIQRYENGFTELENPAFLKFIKGRYMNSPSRLTLSLEDTNKTSMDYSQYGQSLLVDRALNMTENGFFVECGAFNGEYLSNTLYLESVRGWNGLLIEADPLYFKALMKKHRKSFAINTCLSTSNKTGRFNFVSNDVFGRLEDPSHGSNGFEEHRVSVPCFPLYSLMLALDRHRIDYFSLDVEGAEMNILHTIPFDKLHISIFTVEYRTVSPHGGIDAAATLKKLSDLRQFFAKTSLYKEIGILPWGTHENEDRDEALGVDVIFKRIQ